MKEVKKVYQTNDYSMFKQSYGNRVVEKLHVKRLKDSFNKTYLFNPIIVNEKFEIIDGAHRFTAAYELGLPINFLIVENYSLKEIQILNENAKNWKKIDYLKSYCDLGHSEYIKFKNFMGMFPEFGMRACEIILRNKLSGGSLGKDKKLISITNKSGKFAVKYFENGSLEIPDFELSIKNAKKILMIKQYYDGFNRPAFVSAMIGIFKIEGYSHSQFIKKLSNNPTALQHCTNITQYKLLIEDIYNFKSRNKISLRF